MRCLTPNPVSTSDTGNRIANSSPPTRNARSVCEGLTPSAGRRASRKPAAAGVALMPLTTWRSSTSMVAAGPAACPSAWRPRSWRASLSLKRRDAAEARQAVDQGVVAGAA